MSMNRSTDKTCFWTSCHCCGSSQIDSVWTSSLKGPQKRRKQSIKAKKLFAESGHMALTILIAILVFIQTASANDVTGDDTKDNSKGIDVSNENVIEEKAKAIKDVDEVGNNIVNENVIKDIIDSNIVGDNNNQHTPQEDFNVESDINDGIAHSKSSSDGDQDAEIEGQNVFREKDVPLESGGERALNDAPLSGSNMEHEEATENSNKIDFNQEGVQVENDASNPVTNAHEHQETLDNNEQAAAEKDPHKESDNRDNNLNASGPSLDSSSDEKHQNNNPEDKVMVEENISFEGDMAMTESSATNVNDNEGLQDVNYNSATNDEVKETVDFGKDIKSPEEPSTNLDQLVQHETSGSDLPTDPEVKGQLEDNIGSSHDSTIDTKNVNAEMSTETSPDKNTGVSDGASETGSDTEAIEKPVISEVEKEIDAEVTDSSNVISGEKPSELEGKETQFDENPLNKDGNPNVVAAKTDVEKKEEIKKTEETGDEKVEPGSNLVQEAGQLLNQTRKNSKRAYKLFAQAADLGNTVAMEKIGIEYLLGDHLPRNLTKANEIFQKLSDHGSPFGQQGLAFMYGTGTGVNSSQAKALIYTTFATLGGSVIAEMMLGYRYWGGIGVIQSCESALTHYKKVSQKVAQDVQPMGSPAVHRIRLYDELEQGSTGGNLDDDLLQYYQFLADKGDVQAQVGLGQLYFQGARGVNVDHQKAFQYFKQAADAGNANAQAYLGKMYLEGNAVVPQNNETAFEYFSKAVEQGNPIGHSGLGLLYLHGKGVVKDYAKAVTHFNLAAEQGWPEAQLQLGNIYYHGHGVNRDYQKAVKYFTLASQSGNVLAVYNLATMHATGNGVLRSCHTATELFKSVAERGRWSGWFTEAYAAYKAGDIDTALIKYYMLAELGYEAAQSNVAYIFDKGESTLYAINETYARALLQWNRAASQGYTVARVKVGDYHFYGLGTEVDYEVAALHYRVASEQQNNAQAMFNLGYMHEQGLGLRKDIHLAKRFYDMAAESNPDAQVPVLLAMVKLGAYFTLDWAKQNYKFWEKFNIKELLGKDWDLYLITGLAVILGLLLLIRRTQA